MDDLHEDSDEIREIIRDYGLEEDEEHVIINLKTAGKSRRIYLLKRKYIRIIKPDGNFEDYPLRDIVDAIIKYPGLRLSESLLLKKQD
ncbi:MAG: hypothetical protein N2257_03965 [Thermodesulfovibrionales bacterium]|nr:hypothetical protein [Thermodesulfovibrionales bacterium]